MSNRWVEHKGKRILYSDYRGSKTTPEMIATLEEACRIMADAAQPVLLLANFDGTHASPEYMERVKELGRTVIEPKTARATAVGITGVKRILFKGYIVFTGGKMKAFETEEEGLEYLAG